MSPQQIAACLAGYVALEAREAVSLAWSSVVFGTPLRIVRHLVQATFRQPLQYLLWMQSKAHGSSVAYYLLPTSGNLVVIFPSLPETHNSSCFTFGSAHGRWHTTQESLRRTMTLSSEK